MKLTYLACAFALLPLAGSADAISFDARTGALAVEQDGVPLWTSGAHGLWRLRFRDGSFLSAADFATNAVAGGHFACTRTGAAARLSWTSPRADVVVESTPSADGSSADLRAAVTPRAGESLMLDFPAHLRFPAETVKDFVYPGRGMGGPGLAFNAKFFLPSAPDSPHGWDRAHKSGAGYARLYGGNLRMQPMDAEPVALKVTDAGRAWLGHGPARRFDAWKRPVIRPPAPGQSDLVLIDTEFGPYLSAKRFGGTGALWRFGVADGSSSRDRVPPAETFAVRHLLPRLAEKAPGRTKVALVALACGPKVGGFVHATVADWRTTLQGALPRGCVYEEIKTIPALLRALAAQDHLLVVNPYGEFFPVDAPENYLARIDDLRAFVKSGGNWLETGGYSFYYALHPGKYLSCSAPYPPLFSDFAQLATTDGRRVALYGVQPRPAHEPWRNPAPFVPGETGVGADADGGWFFHAFAAYAKPGETVRTPRVRIRTGATLDAALADYAAANTLDVPLAAKITAPGALGKFKRAPLLHIHGTAAGVRTALAHVPVPSIYHPSNYLKGGFDKEYPDHLPPHPSYGTMDELVALFRDARAQGHLVSPYTNPTWWCDHPRGPSFVAAGEAPLLVGLDGKPNHERYAQNDGWTITYWHPDVQKANRKTVREFTQDAPVDLLFQDQCGARGWHWDFNPASPSPMAYAEGVVSMNEEDSRVVPLGTEDGWDQVANRQAALCGCSWRVVPTSHRPVWRDQYKDVYPADTWRIEPVNLRLFHDKLLFYMHDLGAFVTNEKVLAWMFALGYNLSLNGAAHDFASDTPRFKWYEWLHVLQSRVVSRIAGQPLRAFHHDRAPLLARSAPGAESPCPPDSEADDGVVTAQWGDVSVAVNLGDVPRTVAGRRLAPYGWWIEAPGLRSGHLAGEDAFVEDASGRWAHAPDPATAPVRPTEAQRTRAPRDLPETPRTIAVADFGPKFIGAWVRVTPAEWVRAFESDAQIAKQGLKVVRLRTYAELAAALKGRTAFAVVNPYGEYLPTEGPGTWAKTVDAIRAFVAQGGHWVETGSATFYTAGWLDESGVQKREPVHGGASRMGFALQMDDIDEPAVTLCVLPEARDWFPDAVRGKIGATLSCVNRGLLDRPDSPLTALVADGRGRVWLGFHQIGGWGSFWRVGGSAPDPDAVRAALPAALAHAFAVPPGPGPANARRRVVKVK